MKELVEKWGDEHDVYTHHLESLLQRLPLWTRFKAAPVWNDFARQVNSWKPEWRYEGHDMPVEKAKAFLASVDKVLEWLGSNS